MYLNYLFGRPTPGSVGKRRKTARPPVAVNPGAHPVLGVPVGSPGRDGGLAWRSALTAPAWPERDCYGRGSTIGAAPGELALAAGAEFFRLSCADIEVSELYLAKGQTWPTQIGLSIVVTPAGPGAARFELHRGEPAEGALLASATLRVALRPMRMPEW
ncbi:MULTISPECIES: hypothetical protein [unclassified Crossiella]|uniref:hypothetical protein n=1 Tax=unclassified Crossiella TaxID=2620835 RepID=UPI001FFFFE89|nr:MULTISPECIES: hypothetical protein [unclassified Crossiella]MCK2244245.1 hypothetical protein [Crossiella sp. S99.2]MCK2258049.1 hypothetical protein [Crossiella sp. S99.1]